MTALASIAPLVFIGSLVLVYSDATDTLRFVGVGGIGLLLGGLIAKAPFPPFTTGRSVVRKLFAEPGPSGFKIRVSIGESPMDVSCLDHSNACSIGPEFVTDLNALFVADPFVITNEDRAWIFFEAMEEENRKGVICAAWSDDGKEWTYHGKVLDEPFHLSYPQIIKHDDQIWMIPESCHDYSVRLYRADNFPNQWTHTNTLLSGYCYCDNTVFQKEDTWWLFSSIGNDHLNLYQADSIKGPWIPHESNPVVRTGARDSRMAGSVIYKDGKAIRVAQDCVEKYGHFLRGYEITKLNTKDYQEKELVESPILYPSPGSWKKHGCHHLDQTQFKGKWLIVSDGY